MSHTARFPVDVTTGWTDYSPAFRHETSELIRSRLAGFASRIRSAAIRVFADDRDSGHRRCELTVRTTEGNRVSASAQGTDLGALVNRVADAVSELLGARKAADAPTEERQRIA